MSTGPLDMKNYQQKGICLTGDGNETSNGFL